MVEGVGVLGLPETPKCFSQHFLARSNHNQIKQTSLVEVNQAIKAWSF
jgi:hypothetical protein